MTTKDLEAERTLSVAVLTRTGCTSGHRFACAIRKSQHKLCGVMAERRLTLVKGYLRRKGIRALVRSYGLGFVFNRLWQVISSCTLGSDRDLGLFKRVPVVEVRQLNSPFAISILASWNADVIVVANSPILSPKTISCCKRLTVNFHSGRLPEYGGLASEFWTLYNRCSSSWVTWHEVTPALDSGPILAETPVSILDGDTPGLLYERNVEAGEALLLTLLDRIAVGEASPVRMPGNAHIRHWPTAKQRRELARRDHIKAST